MTSTTITPHPTRSPARRTAPRPLAADADPATSQTPDAAAGVELTAEHRARIRNQVLTTELAATKQGRRILGALRDAEASTRVPVLLTPAEQTALLHAAHTTPDLQDGAPTPIYADIITQISAHATTGPCVIITDLARLRTLWLHHLGYPSSTSQRICRALERAGLHHLSAIVTLTDTERALLRLPEPD